MQALEKIPQAIDNASLKCSLSCTIKTMRGLIVKGEYKVALETLVLASGLEWNRQFMFLNRERLRVNDVNKLLVSKGLLNNRDRLFHYHQAVALNVINKLKLYDFSLTISLCFCVCSLLSLIKSIQYLKCLVINRLIDSRSTSYTNATE